MTRFSRILAFALLVPALTLGACDDPEEPDDDPAENLEFVRLTVGTQTVTINAAGTVTGGAITLARNTPTTISATFLDASSQTITLPTAEFELRVTPASGAVTFTRTSNFAGTLTGTTAGATTAQIEVFHTQEQHADWGPKPVSITVQ